MTATQTVAPRAGRHATTGPDASDAERPIGRRRRRGWAIAGLVIVSLLGIAFLAYLGGGTRTGSLDPAATDPGGSRALAQILGGQGVTVVSTDRAQSTAEALRAAGSDSTLLITTPGLLSPRMAATLPGIAVGHVVLVGDVPDAVGPWPSGVVSGGNDTLRVRERSPDCSWQIPLRAGSATTGGTVFDSARFDSPGGGTGVFSCYGSTVVELPAGTAGVPTTVVGSVTLLGSGDLMTNAALADGGNASLATGVLGRSHTLVWWRPSVADPLLYDGPAPPTVSELVPPWVGWALLQLLIGVLVLAYARGRRLGPVVTEPLPVVVRAAEATEGLSRLYRRSRDRDHAGRGLAAATARNLRTALHLPRRAPVDAVAQAAAIRTGRSASDLLALLDPTAPPDDAALVRLADDLDTLERQVRRA